MLSKIFGRARRLRLEARASALPFADCRQLETLKSARANDCPWDEWTCYFAADYGHLEVLRWARANGAPLDEDTRRLTASKGYVET